MHLVRSRIQSRWCDVEIADNDVVRETRSANDIVLVGGFSCQSRARGGSPSVRPPNEGDRRSIALAY
jgi:hypothetical protein